MQALRPLHRNLVALRRRDQAERHLIRQWTVPLSVIIHLPTKLTVSPGILTGHVIDRISRAGLDDLVVLALLYQSHQAMALLRIRGGEQQRLPTGGGHGVPKRGEDHKEEEKNQAEECS